MIKKVAKPITVLLADDHAVVRQGLKRLLKSERDIEVVGEASNGHEAVVLTLKLHPAVVVMDIAMPRMNGLTATRQIMKADPSVKILILSAHSDDAYVDSVMSLEVVGYLIKQNSARFLPEAIREVRKGHTFFSPAIAKHLADRQRDLPQPRGRPMPGHGHLTPREQEVLKLIAEGRSSKQIAACLRVSVKTSDQHRSSLKQKLGLRDTAGLTRYAIKAGIVSSSVHLTIV